MFFELWQLAVLILSVLFPATHAVLKTELPPQDHQSVLNL